MYADIIVEGGGGGGGGGGAYQVDFLHVCTIVIVVGCIFFMFAGGIQSRSLIIIVLLRMRFVSACVLHDDGFAMFFFLARSIFFSETGVTIDNGLCVHESSDVRILT